MSMIKKYSIPIIAVLCFDLMVVAAIMGMVYSKDGIVPPINEVVFSTPIVYFWILWSSLIFYCINGIVKEYNILVISISQKFPLVPYSDVKKTAKQEMLCAYSKKLLLPLVGLPFLCLGFNGDKGAPPALTTVIVLLIPFMIDLSLYCWLYLKTRKRL